MRITALVAGVVAADSSTSTGSSGTPAAADTGDIDEVSGVGDAAFWDKDNTVYAKAKALMIQVNGLSDKDASVALAQAVVDALP